MLLKGWKWYLIAGLIVAVVAAAWQWRAEIQRAAELSVTVDQLHQAVESREGELALERERRARLDEILAEREARRQEIENELSRVQTELRETGEGSDEEYAVCRDVRVPDDLRERLREFARPGDDNGK